MNVFERASCDSAFTCGRLEEGCQLATALKSRVSLNPTEQFDLGYLTWNFKGSEYQKKCPNFDLLLTEYLQKMNPPIIELRRKA